MILTPTPENYPPPLEDSPAHGSTPWPEAGRMSGNLFEIRKDWPIPSTSDTVNATIPKHLIKIEPQVPSATVSRPELCGWGQNCPICKNVDENWNGDDNLQDQSQQANKNTQMKDTPQMYLVQNEKQTLVQNVQHPQNYQVTQNPQPMLGHSSMLWTGTWNKPHLQEEEEWKKRMEKLNEKYGLHC